MGLYKGNEEHTLDFGGEAGRLAGGNGQLAHKGDERVHLRNARGGGVRRGREVRHDAGGRVGDVQAGDADKVFIMSLVMRCKINPCGDKARVYMRICGYAC